MIVGLKQHRVLSTQQNVVGESLQEAGHRLLPHQISLVEEIFRVGSIVVDEVDEELLVRVVDVTVEEPLVEVGEVNLTARPETLDEEAFDVGVEDRRVLVVQQAEEVGAGRQFAVEGRCWVDVQELCDVDENFSDVLRVYRQLEQRLDVLRVNNVAVVVQELDDAVAEDFEDETLDDVALVEGIFRCEGFQATKASASLEELFSHLTDV